MLPHLSLGELLVLLVVVLLIFGPNRLPEVAASFGKSIKSFREGLREAGAEKSKTEVPKDPQQKSL